MKLYIARQIVLLAVCCSLFACSESEYDYPDNDSIELSSITGIKLMANHYNLLADGKSQVEIKPYLYKTIDSIEVLDDRIGSDWITYETTTGMEISRYFSTSDESLIGETIEVSATVNGIKSEPVSFTVTEPLKNDEYEEITFPVIFHVCQTNNEINSYGGSIESKKVTDLIDRMNNVFSGSISNNATGVDTKIRFKAALYGPDGESLNEPGINRVITDDVIDNANNYKHFIESYKLDWPHSKYLNIWLISDRDGAYRYFGSAVTNECIPVALNPGTDITEMPQGLFLNEIEPNSWTPEPKNIGVKFKLQLLNQVQVDPKLGADNDFMFYLGQYFGLLPTNGWVMLPYDPWFAMYDFCDDTFSEYFTHEGSIKNTDAYRFTSENVMDDQQGLHRSVSKDQTKRIRWIIENCPERSAWKSDFAFTAVE